MAISVDQIVVKFPHKAFLVIDYKLDYHSTHDTWNLPYGNTYTLTKTMGGGTHYYIWIVMKTYSMQEYQLRPVMRLCNQEEQQQLPYNS